jgi:hypothetical protein
MQSRIDAAPQQGGEEHPQDFNGGGKTSVKKNMTRIVALALVVLMVVGIIASMILPYIHLH